MITIDQLQLLRSVADLGGISPAARAARQSPSAATRRIAALEAELGVRLLLRTTRRVQLTEAGIVFLDWARDALDGLDAARDQVSALQGQARGLVRMACPDFIAVTYMPAFLTAFSDRHPQIEISIVTTDRTVDLASDQFDLAIHSGRPPADHLIGRKLWDVRTVICAAPAYLERHGTPAQPSDLTRHRCIAHTVYEPKTWRFSKDGESFAQAIRPAVSTSNTLLLRNLVLGGFGIASTTRRAVEADLVEGRLVELFADFKQVWPKGAEPATWVVFPHRTLFHRTRVVIDALAAHFGQLAGQDPVRADIRSRNR